MSDNGNWRNRIIERRMMKPGDLLDHPGQWRDHSKGQAQAMRGVLNEVGITDSLKAWYSERAGGKLVTWDGHLRKALNPNAEWPVDITDLNDEEADYALATHDPLGAMALTDKAALESLLDTVRSADEGVQKMLADLAEKAGLRYGDQDGRDVEPQIDRAEELREKWGVQPGDLWQLGEHRLICGDCTDRAVVERVMGGERAQLMLTDPPYGVSYADKNRFLNTIARGNCIQEPIEGDHQTPEQMDALWRAAFGCVRDFVSPGACYYVTGPQGGDLLLLLLLALRDCGWPLHHMLIWAKNNHVLGRSDYNYQHEPIIYGWVQGSHKWYGQHDVSLWQIDKPLKSDLHPTTKPVELFERAAHNSSAEGQIVLDPFLGSGSTLIACENLGRKCRAIEISPGYVAVALQRWADLTGATPELIERAGQPAEAQS